MGKSHRLDSLAGRHSGERVVLVANGPSLRRMDLSFLFRETTIGLNKIYLGFRKFHFYPRYYVAVNEKVLQQSVHDIRAMNCVKFLSSRAGDHIPEDALTHHINSITPPARFCKNIVEGVHEGGTVTYAALQIAYFLGFQEVIVIGLDHRFSYRGKPNDPGILNGPDPNHFCENYFGYGQRWDNPDLKSSEESYAIARNEYEKAGRRIWDATVEGACTVFEKIDYKHYFNLC